MPQPTAPPARTWIRDRIPETGETCTCGRLAIVVYVFSDGAEVPDCGIRDGGAS